MYNIIDINAKKAAQGAYAIIQLQDNYFLVDKADTFDAGWETMIFPCDKDGEPTSWVELYCDRTDKSILECIKEFVDEYGNHAIEHAIDLEGSLD